MAERDRVWVAVRVRPVREPEAELRAVDDSHLSLTRGRKTFHSAYARVFGPSASQRDSYRSVRGALRSAVVEGASVAVLAYGQTGSGKTHTICGPRGIEEGGDDGAEGIVPRACKDVFRWLAVDNTASSDSLQPLSPTSTTELRESEYTVQCSYLEVYNENIYDLLDSSKGTQARQRLRERGRASVSDDPVPPAPGLKVVSAQAGSGVVVPDLRWVVVSDAAEMRAVFQQGFEQRRVRDNLYHEHSSRSHTVFQVDVTRAVPRPDGKRVLRRARLRFVDLAGSERFRGDHGGQRLESVAINRSLSTLLRCMLARQQNDAHIPYRDSALTRLLQDSLDGGARLFLFVTVSPARRAADETYSSLKFADAAQQVVVRPVVHELVPGSDDSALLHQKMRYERHIEALKAELKAMRSPGSPAARRLRDENRRLKELLSLTSSALTSQKKNVLKLAEELRLAKTGDLSSSSDEEAEGEVAGAAAEAEAVVDAVADADADAGQQDEDKPRRRRRRRRRRKRPAEPKPKPRPRPRPKPQPRLYQLGVATEFRSVEPAARVLHRAYQEPAAARPETNTPQPPTSPPPPRRAKSNPRFRRHAFVQKDQPQPQPSDQPQPRRSRIRQGPAATAESRKHEARRARALARQRAAEEEARRAAEAQRLQRAVDAQRRVREAREAAGMAAEDRLAHETRLREREEALRARAAALFARGLLCAFHRLALPAEAAAQLHCGECAKPFDTHFGHALYCEPCALERGACQICGVPSGAPEEEEEEVVVLPGTLRLPAVSGAGSAAAAYEPADVLHQSVRLIDGSTYAVTVVRAGPGAVRVLAFDTDSERELALELSGAALIGAAAAVLPVAEAKAVAREVHAGNIRVHGLAVKFVVERVGVEGGRPYLV